MRIAIIGAGGVGGWFGGLLARAGREVHVLARGEHLATIRAHGLALRAADGTTPVPVHATDDPAALAAPFAEGDLAIVAVKAYSLAEVAPAVARLAARGALVLPLLNGVDAADALATLGVPRERILGGVTYISAARVAPGVVERRSDFQRIVVGELDGGRSARAARVADAFAAAGIETVVADDIAVELWRKLVFLASISGACGVVRAPIGPVRERPYGPLLLERLVREAVAVARARGVALPDDVASATLARIAALPAGMTPSFLLDVLAGGRTELDVLGAAVSRMARAAGVETPAYDTVTTILSPAGSVG